MKSRTTRHDALVCALTFIFILTSFAPASFAQHRRTSPRKIPQAQKATPRPQLEGPKHERPPRTFDVLNYTIHTRFDAPNRTVLGDETVTLKPLAGGFQTFDLDASSMKIEAVTLADSNTTLQWTQPSDKLAINLDRAYEPTESINVRIQYRAVPEKGLYFIPQTRAAAAGLSRPAQIWSQGEPEENHYWFPCYDFPDDKATSEQYITTGADEIAISNGALLETTTNADSTHTFHWKMEQPHSSYLISLVVGNYTKLTDTYKNIPVEYYTYRGTEEDARRAFAKTPEMMRVFSEKLNFEFPFNKYAQTIVANFIFGGMENITATTHADTEILGTTTKESQLSTENLVSHELSHSWFGDLVTCKDWSQAWLNEGFATFMEAAFRESEAGHDAYLAEMRSSSYLYFLEDTLKYRRPIVYDRYRSPIDLFDATLYKKGALILHMLRETVGDEMFWKALNKYLNENQNKLVETSDLERAFEETTGKHLDWFFDQWVYKAGYPELRVRSVYEPRTRVLTLDVTQTQTPDATTPAVFRLSVEIELATAQGKRTEPIEITGRHQTFSFKLDSKPLLIRFDKGERILKKLDFPQPTARLAYQLANSSDAVGRIEAAEALALMAKRMKLDSNVIAALQRSAATDSYDGVRAASSSALKQVNSLTAKSVATDEDLLFTPGAWLRKVSAGKYKTQGQPERARANAPGI
ncbi:MAG: aminopeptidase [Acidobacteriota bacterium]|jgi:aminopeptidase N|nr:aminopeptidase [Acidobacteriota bacterium]